MDDLLIPDTPAGQRSNDATEVEASCCSPIRLKFNTFPIKMFDLVYFICGIASIALGIVACVFRFHLNGLSIPAGIVFLVTASVGEFTKDHGIMSTVYGFLNHFCFVWSFVLWVAMQSILVYSEKQYKESCGGYDCKDSDDWLPENCCSQYNYIVLEWKKVGIDLGILVVGVIVMVTSVLAVTFSLRNVNWVKVCNLKKNDMNGNELYLNSTQVSASSGMKRCCKPSDGREHRCATITCSIIHIILGLISAGLGITAVFVGCKYAHIGIPIWTGLLVIVVTGIFGLLSATKQGLYIPCFFALSILSLVLSIYMFTRSSFNTYENDYQIYRCTEWSSSCDYSDYCYDCLPGCCSMGDISNDTNVKLSIDSATIASGVLESLVCIVTIVLSLSQLTCYLCCRGTKRYQPNIPVLNAQGVSTMLTNQPVVMNQQAMIVPSNQIMNQNQVNTTEGSATATVSFQPGHSIPLQTGQPFFVQGQPLQVQSQVQPVMFHGQEQPVMSQGQWVMGQGLPMVVQGQGQLMVVQGQGQPMVVQGQVQPMVVQGQVQPMVVQGQVKPMVAQGQGQSMVVQGQAQPMVVQGQAQPMVAHGQAQPVVVQGQSPPVSVQGQGKPLFIQGQVPLTQQGVGQVIMVPPAHGQPPPQLVVYPGQDPTVMSVATQGQPTNISPKDPPSMMTPQGQPPNITPQGQPPNITPQTEAVIAQAMGGQTSDAEAASDPILDPGNVSNPVAY